LTACGETMSVDQQIIERTRRWVERVIVGFNFCPFAKAEVDQGRVRYQVVTEAALEPCLMALAEACRALVEDSEVETTLLIYPAGFESFDRYLELVAIADELMIDQGYEGIFQLASFHPDYCFAGEPEDDPANYTNRSPYPMLHLIREESLEQALESYPDPEQIPLRNIEVAREQGLAAMQAVLESCSALPADQLEE